MQLKLENFEAPLAVLLHLIKSQDINIFNIPIIQITEQYLQYIHQSPLLDFDKAGEYLAMAAQLIEIKAAWLLPALQGKLNEEATSLEEVSEEDPRKPLVEQLLEYEAIKQAAEELGRLPMVGRDTFPSGEAARRREEIESWPAPLTGDPYSLVIAYERALMRFAENARLPKVRVRAQKITIHAKMLALKKYFAEHIFCTFTDLMNACEDRYELIVTIMAILELAKLEQIFIRQEEPFAPIYLERGRKAHEALIFLDDDKSHEHQTQQAHA